MNTGWPLLDLKGRRPKLKYKGLKKFREKKLHQLEYKPQGGVGYRIALFFEPETYRHVASSYQLTAVSGTLTTRAVGVGEGAQGTAGPTAGTIEVDRESLGRTLQTAPG